MNAGVEASGPTATVATETGLKTAARLYKLGYTVLPIKNDGSKAPALPSGGLKPLLDGRPTKEATRKLFAECFEVSFGIGVVCGPPSGGLVDFDFDVPEKDCPGFQAPGTAPAYGPWRDAVVDALGAEFFARLTIVRTPSGGLQVLFRCGLDVPSEKLAILPVGHPGNPRERPSEVIETKGRGGYTACGFGPGYQLEQGSFETVPTISDDEAEELYAIARSLDERPQDALRPPADRATDTGFVGLRPGDGFIRHGPSMRQMLTVEGWSFTGDPMQGGERVVKPGGGRRSRSAVYWPTPEERLTVYTSATALPYWPDPRGTLDAFGVYTWLHHSGDFKAAARDLAAQGFGEQRSAKRPASFPSVVVGDEPRKVEDFADTDLGNAERLVHAHGADLRYCAQVGAWLVWDGKRFCRDETGGAIIRQVAQEVIRQAEQDALLVEGPRREILMKHLLRSEALGKLEAMVELAKSQPGVPALFDSFDADPSILNLQNGTLDLRTFELRKHNRGDLCSRVAKAGYFGDSGGSYPPKWTKFLARIFGGDENLAGFVWRAVGYSLTGQTNERVWFFGHGCGANGKTRFVEALLHALGDYGGIVSPDSLMLKIGDPGISNDIAALKGLRMVAADELPEGRGFNETLLKALTGEQKVRARFLHREFFDFRPQFALWMMGNHKPRLRGTDEAVWDRVRLIPFDARIPEAERDLELKAKLEAEADGILSWAVDGLREYREHGLGKSERVARAVAAYREENDLLGRFVHERTERADTPETPARQLYQAFRAWAIEAGEPRPMSETSFGRSMTERGERKTDVGSCMKYHRRLRQEDSTGYAWEGSE